MVLALSTVHNANSQKLPGNSIPFQGEDTEELMEVPPA